MLDHRSNGIPMKNICRYIFPPHDVLNDKTTAIIVIRISLDDIVALKTNVGKYHHMTWILLKAFRMFRNVEDQIGKKN